MFDCQGPKYTKVHTGNLIDIIVQRIYQFHMAPTFPQYDIRLVSIDVDNTLVDSAKRIPKENIEAIRWAHLELGVHFTINSGRIAASARHFMDLIGVHECFPSLGGVLVHTWDGDILQEHFVDREASLEICTMARSLGIGLFAYRRENWHLDKGQDYWAQSELKASGIQGEMTDIVSFLSSSRANKLLGACLDEDAISRLETMILSRLSDKVDCFKSSPNFLEILPKGVNKGSAINTLCRHYGLKKENVMSIGDYYNDIDMFKASGLSVAMRNAPEEVRNLADYVTESDNEHGAVAEAICRFIHP